MQSCHRKPIRGLSNGRTESADSVSAAAAAAAALPLRCRRRDRKTKLLHITWQCKEPKPLTIEEYRARQPVQANRNIKDDNQLTQIPQTRTPKRHGGASAKLRRERAALLKKSKRRSTTDMGRSVSPMA
ncbi:hypothetical protein ACLKA6_011352 [Drosophila palustris]